MNKEQYFREKIKVTKTTKEKLFYSGVLLFSEYGYANVGIRKLCRTVNIKESSFYNHYKGKKELFDTIMDYFVQQYEGVILTEKEIDHIVSSKDIAYFFRYNMEKFGRIADDKLYLTILQIIFMECFVNEKAFEINTRNLYHMRKEYTEIILTRMIENGSIRNCDVKLITAQFYYGLMGLLNEFLLLHVWEQNQEEIMKKIHDHIGFYIDYLKV
ncbi:TetR/AcrR family transcriptional regulator [Vallitalea okinawensis]|uniref:TetR/AcrR family transcriptional regulator n=1 Tax=Vallitalea okinawensis TaxID=2078660 RepID=UPI000CFD9C72|nr:TetR/AcrR family transcriptional regulator [Vallitalea okinawensis]